ncbi:DUF1217 domain-containing protein [Hoeflea olei]|uniref:Flagellar protein n=1 Tax=Hoeflea olei TaxID=1480615 RepID=A0A1C1YWP2_9HYPH|nr:DUF1217 domain-containing protein [Hoeflea olei]OCW57902.1 hypothetical protein AWJ14_03685 [Hoeflea olei]
MISTYQTYTFYTKDINQTLKRAANDPIVSREQQYYRENIGSIKTVDDFLADGRIYAYAMKAYGLEDMAYAKAFIRKVLESDLTDTSSFANRLSDTKYRQLAAAFDFGATVTSEIVQTTSQIDHLIEAYTQTIADNDSILRQETAYFSSVAPTFTKVDDLLTNTRARDYVFNTFGIDPDTFDYTTIKNVLTSDITDPDSYVNSVLAPQVANWNTQIDDLIDQRTDPSTTAAQKEKIDYLITQYSKAVAKARNMYDMAASFNFNADGTLDPGVEAMTAGQLKMVTESYVLSQPRLTSTGALLNKQYYEETIFSITNIDELFEDERLTDMVRVAFDIPKKTTVSEIRWAMMQDPSDPDGEIHTKADAMIALAKAFNFESDGSITPGKDIQDADQLFTTTANYIDRYNDADDAADEAAIKKYKLYIGLTSNLNDFLSSEPAAVTIREFALKAFNISPDEISTFKLKQVFTSDPYDPNSYVSKMKDKRFLDLAKAFNFAPDGSIGSPRYAQTESEITRVGTAYYAAATRLDKSDSNKQAAEKEVSYYRTQLQNLETLDDLLGDKRLMNVLLTSEGLDPKTLDQQTLRAILTSDLDDPNSFANQQNNVAYRKLAGSFNFDADGVIRSTSAKSVQNERGMVETQHLYLTQTIEQNAGEESVGARLAMYFERMAPTITSTYELLADDALAQFVRTAFSLPDSIASADIDAQKELFERYLDINDLLDPEKVDTLVRRFVALYDVQSDEQNPLITLLSGNASVSFDTVSTFMQLRNG